MTQSIQDQIEEEFCKALEKFRWDAAHRMFSGEKEVLVYEKNKELLEFLKSQGFHISKPLPIEKAPKDGNWILGIVNGRDFDTWIEVYWQHGTWYDEYDNIIEGLTHFMLRPPLPQEEKTPK